MDNIRVIKTGIDVSKIVAQLEQYPEDWGSQRNVDGAQSLLDRGFPQVQAGVLQLVMGAVDNDTQYVGDTEYCIPTPAYNRHTEIINVLSKYFKGVSRCGFLSLPVGGKVGKHIDKGDYYLTRDRYHLSIAGRYKYMVGDEECIVEPGTLLWFNNKLDHGTENIGDCVRVTFVFDVPHDKDNP